jgi:hypothetical protein
MVENAIAIIATSLPALRSMILGTNPTTKGSSSSYAKQYELSSSRLRGNDIRLNSTPGTGISRSTQRLRHSENGSEDSLFSIPPAGELGDQQVVGKITVNTQIETKFEETQNHAVSSRANLPA